MLLRDRISAGSTTSRKPRLPMSEFQRPRPRSRKSSKAEIKVEGQPPLPAAAAGESGTLSTSTLPLQAACNSRPTSTSPPPRLSHVAAIHLPVADLQVCSEFYRDVLGLEIVAHGAEEEGAGGSGEIRLSFGKGRETEIVLYQSDCPGCKGKERLLVLQNMRPGYSLAVSTKEEVRLWEEWLREMGIDVTSAKSEEGESPRVLFRDPDGNIGQLLCRKDGSEE